jgi:hypothetical protein
LRPGQRFVPVGGRPEDGQDHLKTERPEVVHGFATPVILRIREKRRS